MLQCVLTDQRIKAIEQVHGYFSSEQVNMDKPKHPPTPFSVHSLFYSRLE